ncbi:MAG: hypothetical protein R8F63_16565 [Acidimicrobiales bacterium]|nr:hypothetical protein [Acidimicrobiales bacterium]
MSERIEALPWDSEFFEVSIGAVDLTGATKADLEEIVAEAQDRRFDCVYGTHTPEGSHTSIAAQDAGFRLVEVNQLMHRRAGPLEHRPTPSVGRIATAEDLEAVDEYLDLLAPWSRFGSDPRFGRPAATRMLRAWIHRAAEEDHRLVTISADEDGITGIGTHVFEDLHRIDLLALTKPGTDASYLHLEELVRWADDGPTLGGPCAARNLAPLRFLEKAGYMLHSVTYTHHWWAEGRMVHG